MLIDISAATLSENMLASKAKIPGQGLTRAREETRRKVRVFYFHLNF